VDRNRIIRALADAKIKADGSNTSRDLDRSAFKPFQREMQ
jgi:hypothetical protein